MIARNGERETSFSPIIERESPGTSGRRGPVPLVQKTCVFRTPFPDRKHVLKPPSKGRSGSIYEEVLATGRSGIAGGGFLGYPLLRRLRSSPVNGMTLFGEMRAYGSGGGI